MTAKTKKVTVPKIGTIGHIALAMMRDNPDVTSDQIRKEVIKKFPESKWNKTHLAWYKHQIRTGKYEFPKKLKKSKN